MSELTPSPTRRRLLTGLGIAAIGGWVWGAPRIPDLFPDRLTFTPIEGVPGFRSLDGSASLSVAGGVFAGLDTPDPAVNAAVPEVKRNPCRALFGSAPADVPIALFSDFNCPNCPAMDANIMTVLGRTPGTSLHRHELPLLGRTSVVASQAVLAADLQGKYAEMHDALLRTPAVTDLAFVRGAATRAGLDADRLITDMDRPDIAGALNLSKALSRLLGLYGTPAAVIGGTVVLGTKSVSTIERLIVLEAERDATCS